VQNSVALRGAADEIKYVVGPPSTTEIVRDAWNGDSRSLKVIRYCANRRGMHDFQLTLSSNLTSISNRSWDITPTLWTEK